MRQQVAAPGKGPANAHALTRQGRCQSGGGHILGHVIRLQPRHHDVGVTGVAQRRGILCAEDPTLLEHAAGDA